VSNKAGKPSLVDRMTENKRRISYARVCIEISAIGEFIHSFGLVDEGDEGDGVDVTVEYPWLPKGYVVCKVFGHDREKNKKIETKMNKRR